MAALSLVLKNESVPANRFVGGGLSVQFVYVDPDPCLPVYSISETPNPLVPDPRDTESQGEDIELQKVGGGYSRLSGRET